MTTREMVKFAEEFVSIPLTQLRESSMNPRKSFDEERLAELTQSIREKGVLSPLVVRRVEGHFEVVAGARRYRAAQEAGLAEVPARIAELTDAEAQEIQIVENLIRSDLHPFEEAQAFRAILDREGSTYTIDKLAARLGKSASFIARRLKLLDLTDPVAKAFAAGYIGIEHALLIARLAPDVQEEALTRCFDGYFAGDISERSLVPMSRLQAWVERNVYLNLKSVPFSKDDETLVPEAGSCASCPKRTGFNTLLFGEVADACTDAACFNRKLDAHVAKRVKEMPDLVMISDHYNSADGTPVLPSRRYVEVVARKSANGKATRPEQRLCSHLKPAIHVDGVDKGRLVKVCAEQTCTVHFRERREAEKRELQWKAEKALARKKAKRTQSFRYRLFAEVLKRVKSHFGCEEMRMIARFVLEALPHELACRLAKRHNLKNAKEQRDWEMAEKARALYRRADASELAILIFEAMLLGPAGQCEQSKDEDLLAAAASHFKVDGKALRAELLKSDKKKAKSDSSATAKKTTSKRKVSEN